MRTLIHEHHHNINFTSDPHYFHYNILKKHLRPFATIEEMHDVFVKNWNSRATDKSTTYVIGDVSFGNAVDTHALLSRLRGHKRLILGNHDKAKLINVYREHFEIIEDMVMIHFTALEREAHLCHFPMLTWNKSHYGSWMLHGHSHGTCRYPDPTAKIMDVGVDCNDYKPVTATQIYELMETRNASSTGHHTPRK